MRHASERGTRNYGQRTFIQGGGGGSSSDTRGCPFFLYFLLSDLGFLQIYSSRVGARWLLWVQSDQVRSSFCSKDAKRPGVIKTGGVGGFNGRTGATDERGVSVLTVSARHAERTAELWPRTVPGPGVDGLRDSLLLTLSPLPPSHSLTHSLPSTAHRNFI